MSTINSCSNILLHNLDKNVLNTNVSPISNTTVQDLLLKINDITLKVGMGDEHYFADLDIGYTEDTFPVTSY